MIHYHGFGINPFTALVETVIGGHALFTWRQVRQSQVDDALQVCQSFMIDNGAFTAWKAGQPIVDWSAYYEWVYRMARLPSFDFAVIPDVIDGSEADNDRLLEDWPHSEHIGAPVWHLHESLERLDRLAHEWPRICLGSSGSYANPGSDLWWSRMNQVMSVVCDSDGLPACKLHGLRMLNPELFTRLPLASADSTNVARNIGIDARWTGRYSPPDRASRAYILRRRIEAHNAPIIWAGMAQQNLLLN